MSSRRAFGNILSGSRASVEAFSRALNYTRAELRKYRSCYWIVDTSSESKKHKGVEAGRDIEFQMGRRHARETGTEPPRAKAPGERYQVNIDREPAPSRATSGGAPPSVFSASASSSGRAEVFDAQGRRTGSMGPPTPWRGRPTSRGERVSNPGSQVTSSHGGRRMSAGEEREASRSPLARRSPVGPGTSSKSAQTW